MSARRNVPPFEIMGSSPPTPPTYPGAGAGAGLPGAGGGEGRQRRSMGERVRSVMTGLSADRLGQWWTRANSPVMVRMPRGYLVLVTAAGLVLVLLAYWVGGVRGYSRAIAEMEAGSTGAGMVRTGESMVTPQGYIRPQGDPAAPSGTISDPGADPREPGRNYLILARYPLDDAQRLIGFLKTEGVDAIGVPVHTSGLYLVIARRGFDRNEVNSETGIKFKEQMRRIGRAWKAHNGGKGGDDLASMYFSRYDAPPPPPDGP